MNMNDDQHTMLDQLLQHYGIQAAHYYDCIWQGHEPEDDEAAMQQSRKWLLEYVDKTYQRRERNEKYV